MASHPRSNTGLITTYSGYAFAGLGVVSLLNAAFDLGLAYKGNEVMGHTSLALVGIIVGLAIAGWGTVLDRPGPKAWLRKHLVVYGLLWFVVCLVTIMGIFVAVM